MSLATEIEVASQTLSALKFVDQNSMLMPATITFVGETLQTPLMGSLVVPNHNLSPSAIISSIVTL
jgi:hypothetical protein